MASSACCPPWRTGSGRRWASRRRPSAWVGRRSRRVRTRSCSRRRDRARPWRRSWRASTTSGDILARSKGVRILYLSPLKALNNDIYRNLQVPLDGIIAASEASGEPLPRLTVAVRTGDTPQADRQKIVRNPPDILITTPESLHLMLTSKARSALGALSHVIVDEIHSLCADKRGVFLALLLERLERLNPTGFVRVGLSATQRPLEEVARYLGGLAGRPGRAARRPGTSLGR